MNEFKTRYNNHRNSFTNVAKKKSTTLSAYVWQLKKKDIDHDIEWSVEANAKPYPGGGGVCSLCLMEKTFIVRGEPATSLNKRSEIMAKCRHKEPHYLSNCHGLRIPNTVVEDEEDEQSSDEEDILPQEPSSPASQTHHQLRTSSAPQLSPQVDWQYGRITRRRAKDLPNLEFFEL